MAKARGADRAPGVGEAIFSQMYSGETLSSWQVAHEMSVRPEDDALVVSDTEKYSWHLLRLHDSAFLFRLIRMKFLLKFCENSTANFYIHHYGNLDVAEISADGNIINGGISKDVSVNRISTDLFDIEVKFLSCHPTLSIG